MLARHAVTVGCLLTALSLLELCIIMDVRWNLQRLGDVWPAGEGFLGRRRQEGAPPPAASQDASLDITDVDGLSSGLEGTVGSQETWRQSAVIHDGRPQPEATSPVAAVEAAAAAAPPEGPAAPVAVANAEPATDAYSPAAAPAEATSSASAVEAAPPESPAAAVASVDAGAPADVASPVAAPAEATSSASAVDAAPAESPAAAVAIVDAGAPADAASPVVAPAEETLPASPVEEPAVAVAPPESPAAASPVAAVEAARAVAAAPPESPAAANSIADAGPAADTDSPAAAAASADAGPAADAASPAGAAASADAGPAADAASPVAAVEAAPTTAVDPPESPAAAVAIADAEPLAEAASPVAAPAEATFPASLVEEASSAAVAPSEGPEVAVAGVDAGAPADVASPVAAAEGTLPASPVEEPAVAAPESPAAARPEEATPLASQADVPPEAAAAAPAETRVTEPSTAAAASEPLQAPKQFVLLSSQRSGSTWLCNLMNHMKGVQCGWREGESGTSRTAGIVSEMMMTYSFLQRRGGMSIGETYPDLRGYSNTTKVPWRKWVADYDRAMKMIADQAKSQRVRAIGFKLMYDQLPSYHLRQFLNHLRERGIIVIHLVREAQLQRFASLAQANPEFMHTTNETAAHYVQEHTPKLNVGLQRIKDFVFRNEFKDTIWKRSLVFDKDITYFYVAYEHLLMHNKRLPALLLIPVLLTGEVMDLGQLVADQYKLHSSKCSKRFDNYEKIMQSIRNTTTHHACRMLDRLEGEGDPVSSS